jgi:phosphoribosylglycinamide formyltransferase 1
LNTPARVAVFASGGGTNLQSLIDHFGRGRGEVASVELVIGSRSGIGALARAEAAGIPTLTVDREEVASGGSGAAMLASLEQHRIDLVVLAGYLKLIPPEVVESFRGRMINIHPALLPAFGGRGMYGLRVHRAVLESGARVTGATVHLVDERYDEGRILAQWPVPVLAGDTPEALAARVLKVEHLILPLAIERLVLGEQPAPPGADAAFELVDTGVPAEASVHRLMG